MRLTLALILTATIIGCGWAGWLGARHIAGQASVLDRVETTFADLRLHFWGPIAPPTDVVIVAIDDETVAATGGYPMDRHALAAIVHTISLSGGRTLAVDLLLVDPTNAQADADLGEALGTLPSVIAAAGRFQDDPASNSPVPRAFDVLQPQAEMLGSARSGLVNIVTDAGGTPRHLPLLFHTPEGLQPSFVLQAVGLFLGSPPPLTSAGVRISGREQPLDFGWHLPIRYLGPSATVPTISATRLLSAEGPVPELDEKLVLLGATATAIGDRFGTPFEPVMPGVEILATGMSNLLEWSGLVRSPTVRWIDVIATVTLVVAGVLAVSVLPLATGSVLFLSLLMGWLAAITVLFGQGYWLSASLPIAGSLLPIVGLIIARQVIDHLKAKRQAVIQRELGRFHAPALERMISENPDFLLAPVEQDAAILFVDLTGFTGLSEQLGPSQTRDFLKDFHTIVVDLADNHGGVILDFMGDGAMIGFGIPRPGPKDTGNALRLAVDLVQTVQGWIGLPDVQAGISDVRVGVHRGPVVLSRLGHENHQQIAATGDCVNVASRLLEVGKDHGALIVASVEALDKAGALQNFPAPKATQAVRIRGREQELSVAFWLTQDLRPHR